MWWRGEGRLVRRCVVERVMEVRRGVCVVERVMGGWCESVCGRGGQGACVGEEGESNHTGTGH